MKIIIDYILLITLIILIVWSHNEDKKTTKELKNLSYVIENMQSQLRLLTPPTELFILPVVKQ